VSQALWSFAGAFLGGFTAGIGMEVVRNSGARRRNRRAALGLHARLTEMPTTGRVVTWRSDGDAP
jgi:hypothetical protein